MPYLCTTYTALVAISISNLWRLLLRDLGYAIAQLAEALRYKSEGHGFDSRWYEWNFSLT
jgi:hypothetical protein